MTTYTPRKDADIILEIYCLTFIETNYKFNIIKQGDDRFKNITTTEQSSHDFLFRSGFVKKLVPRTKKRKKWDLLKI